jgi:WD40 repeat protein
MQESKPLTDTPFVVTSDLAWSEDGRRLAVATERVSVWDVEEGQAVLTPTPAWQINRAVALHPGGKLLAVGGNNIDQTAGGVMVLDITSGETIWSQTGIGWAINDLSFTSDGAEVVSVSQDGSLRAWDTSGGELRSTRRAHGSRIECLDFGRRTGGLCSVGRDGVLRVWGPAGDARGEFPAPNRSAWACEFSPDEAAVAVGLTGGQLYIWDLASGSPQRFKPSPVGMDIVDVAWSESGEAVASLDISVSGNVYISDLETGTSRRLASVPGHSPGFVTFAGGCLAVARTELNAGKEGLDRLYLFDAETGRLRGHAVVRGGGVVGLARHPGGSLLATAHLDGRLRLWSAETADLVSVLDVAKGRGTHVGVAMSDEAVAGIADHHGDGVVHLWSSIPRRDLVPYLSYGEYRDSRFVWTRLLTADRLVGPQPEWR